MHNLDYDANICIMTKFFQLIGGKWKPIILHLIRSDINRFGFLIKHMPKISKKILTEQLRELEEAQIIMRNVLIDKAPKVVVYTLTEKGVSLRNLIDEIISWSIEHMKNDIPMDLVEEFNRNFPEISNALPWHRTQQKM